jgi:hypothetical protein
MLSYICASSFIPSISPQTSTPRPHAMASFVSGGGGSDRHLHRAAEGDDERDMNDLISSYYDLDNDDDDNSGGYNDSHAEPGMDLNSPQFDAPRFTQRRLTEMGLKCELFSDCSTDSANIPPVNFCNEILLCRPHPVAAIFTKKYFHILQRAHPSVPTHARSHAHSHSQRPRFARQ